jgi:predicted DNA-binding transcriptional regulator AlpA
MMSDEWLSLRDVAEMFGVHRNTVKRTPPAVLPYLRIGARGDRRYRRSDVEAMIERRMVR